MKVLDYFAGYVVQFIVLVLVVVPFLLLDGGRTKLDVRPVRMSEIIQSFRD